MKIENSVKSLFCGGCVSLTLLNLKSEISPVIGVCDNIRSKFAKMVMATDHSGCPEHRARKEEDY